MNNALDIALTRIRATIPPEILDYAFTQRELREETFPIDQLIIEKVIRPRVLKDMNITGGYQKKIMLRRSYIEPMERNIDDARQNTGRFVLNGGTIRNNRGGILISPTANGGEVILAGGFVTNNTFYGVRNGSFPYYAGRHYFGGVCRLSGGVVGYNGGYGFSDVASSPATNYYCGGLVVGNADGGARFVDVGGAHCLAGTPRFEDAVKFTKPDQRFIVDGRLRTGAKVPIILKALNSKNNEIEALTAANDYGLDMDQDGTRRPRIVAVPDGENVTDAGRWAKYFSLANTLPEGVIRYCNAVGTSVGLSDRRPSEGVVIMLR